MNAEGTDTVSRCRYLVQIMSALRKDCPWCREQDHRTLAKHLVEETAEVLEAIEGATLDEDNLKEELGDLLFQVIFHCQIASERHSFTFDEVVHDLASKIVERHPWVFGDEDDPDDMMATWESAKRQVKKRSSRLDGIPDPLNTLARAAKVMVRTRDIEITHEITDSFNHLNEPEDFGRHLLALIAKADRCNVDVDQALRMALDALEADVRSRGL